MKGVQNTNWEFIISVMTLIVNTLCLAATIVDVVIQLMG